MWTQGAIENGTISILHPKFPCSFLLQGLYCISREGLRMKKILFLWVLLTVVLFVVHQGWAQPKPETKAPVITHAYAIDKGRLGTILKLYIEADDPNGGMQRIATVINQVGYGHYPTDWTFVKSQNRSHLIGYLQWDTLSSTSGWVDEWTQLTIEVSVFNKSGKESNVVVFPFTFESGNGSEHHPPAPFDQGNIPKLGNVMIQIRGSTADDHDGDRIR